MIALLAHLAAGWGVIHAYQLLDIRYEVLFGFLCAGWLLHYHAPPRAKRAVFLAISLAAGCLLVPARYVAALLAAAGAVYAASLLDSGRLKAAAIALLIGLMAAGRAGLGWAGWLEPELCKYFGALFMFRTFNFLKDTHGRPRADPIDFFSYIFMAPNFYFLLFPIVDYTRFTRSFLARPQHELAWSGADSIFRGATHLLVYGVIASFGEISVGEIASGWGFARLCLLSAFSLLRLSGTFHIAIGIMRLFGYDLPRPCRHYFLSESFLEYWNRSNIYWKNFMVKTIYLPLFFRLMPSGRRRAVVGAGAAVFASTWLLHLYQQFWLTGGLSWRASELLFWIMIGFWATASLVKASNAPEAPAPPVPRWARAGRAALVFGGLALLLGLSAIPSVEAGAELFRRVFAP